MGFVHSISLLVLLTGGASAFVFSCEEVKYKLINSNLQESTQYVCLVPEEGYTGAAALRNIYAQVDKVSTSFEDLLNVTCIERPANGAWRIVADNPVNLDCTQEFTLIFTSSNPYIRLATQKGYLSTYKQISANLMIVSPRSGIKMEFWCAGRGNVTLYTGAGSGVGEFRYPMYSWRCADVPNWIVAFDNVITIEADKGLQINYYLWHYDSNKGAIHVSSSVRLAVMSSGRSDNLQNLHPEQNVVTFDAGRETLLSAEVTSSFDNRNGGSLALTSQFPGYNRTQTFVNQTTAYLEDEYVYSVKVEYKSKAIDPQDLWDSQDNFVVELFLNDYSTTLADLELTTPKATPKQEATTPKSTPQPTADADPYCGCALDKKFGMPENWTSTDIWIDVAIILDTSAAMEQGFVDATSLIESFIGTEDGDTLITDTKANFYTRVGLIAMSDKAEIIYNLNMTKYDTIKDKVQVKTNVPQINVMDAFYAAQQMLIDGRKNSPDRATTRQVIYYMTNSDPNSDLGGIEQFTGSDGIIIVNNFLEKGEVERPGLRNLASPGYYYTDIQDNYMATIQLFCKANCYCRSETGQTPYAGNNPDIAVKASGGCLRATPAGVPFSKARENCANNGGGLIASIHDGKKGQFVNQIMTSSTSSSDYYWIGYSKSDAGWTWEDKSIIPYTNWDVDEPSTASIAKCAYVDSTTPNILWGAGNCNVGFPFACEFAPCSAGNQNC